MKYDLLRKEERCEEKIGEMRRSIMCEYIWVWKLKKGDLKMFLARVNTLRLKCSKLGACGLKGIPKIESS